MCEPKKDNQEWDAGREHRIVTRRHVTQQVDESLERLTIAIQACAAAELWILMEGLLDARKILEKYSTGPQKKG